MDLPDKSNPQQATAPAAKKVRQIIPSGVAKSASRPASRRFFDYVFAASPKEILVGVVTNTFVPRMKAAGEEAFNGFLHGMLWGGGSSPTSQIVQGTVLRGGGMNYNAISNGNPQVLAAAASSQASGPYQDLIVPSQEFAEALLAYMFDLHNQYRVVAVADLYEAAGRTPDTQLSGLGWYSLDGSRITKERDGYRLSLPRPQKI